MKKLIMIDYDILENFREELMNLINESRRNDARVVCFRYCRDVPMYYYTRDENIGGRQYGFDVNACLDQSLSVLSRFNIWSNHFFVSFARKINGVWVQVPIEFAGDKRWSRSWAFENDGMLRHMIDTYQVAPAKCLIVSGGRMARHALKLRMEHRTMYASFGEFMVDKPKGLFG